MDARMWRAFAEASPDIVLVVDLDGTVLSVNRNRAVFREMDIVGAKIWEFAVGDAQQRLQDVIARVVESRQAVCYEHAGFRTSGEEGWYDVRAIPLLDAGRVERILWVSSDVTERRLATQRLEASERRFRALVEHGSDCIVLVGEDGRIKYVSPAMTRSIGYTAEEMIGKMGLDFVHPDDQTDSGVLALTGRPGASMTTTVRARHKDGSWRWQEGTATNLLHDPAVGAYVINRLDVTERKKEVLALSFQAALLAQVSEPIVATTREGVITYWNAAAERVFGWTAAEAIGKVGEELFRSSFPQGKDEMIEALRETRVWRGPLVVHDKAGRAISVEASIRSRLESGDGIVVLQDVSARRELEDQLRQSQKMEAIGLLAGGVAHDFNNLLAVILGFSELAARKLPPGHPVAQQLSEVFDAARRGADLTRKLLAFSRKQIIQRRPIDVGVSVTDFARLLGRIVGEDIELVVETPPGPLVVRADAVQIEQVLLNLCTNARQAMPGGGKLHLTVKAVALDEDHLRGERHARPGPYAEIAVTDTGIGMDEATRARIFEPFFTTKREGTGLGLATVYGIVRQHGGVLHADSAPGRGTTMRVLLPLAPEGEDAARSSKGTSTPRPSGGRETILLAEDEPSLRALVTATLSELGYRVVAAADGAQAVREFERLGPEVALVLLDVVMPHLDARQAYERILAIRPDARVLFMTGYAPESTRLAQLVETGRVDLLEKPFTPEALAAKVRSMLDARVTAARSARA